ncbi:succinylglutamate desuccinylase/aspartoacylase family protein [uncultured Eudoraea sp.]|uniref:succinylglutamate desuccinylase/aspartoacylase family protein n=1 Tax=uncultured Eudoraea sp. TaxID=1035614 RepID=UPI0026099321|nr:succinylglutamate desuccinylase/aspartoacylase family protein [uncultured Eudoraea sp.]
MTQIQAKSIKKLKSTRIIGHVSSKETGPTVVYFAGIHGNEPSGVEALDQVFKQLKASELQVTGSVFGIKGNLPALLEKKRFLEHDLNRIWTRSGIDKIEQKSKPERSVEENELSELHQLISDIFATHAPPYYFIDFHTTSSPTLPFITINDALINREFARLFPVPIILGIEEYLEGPLLNYINEKGYVSLGFESGQHFTEEAVKNSVSFIWLAMIYCGVLTKEQVPDYKKYHDQLNLAAKGNNIFYEIIHRRRITESDDFKMLPGFRSFEKLEKGITMANHNGEQITAYKDTIVFMPLYQAQGEEGFFLIRKIPGWILSFSAFLRKIKFDSFLALLPGVSWSNGTRDKLMVNLKVAMFFNKPFFHLLGYRNRMVDETHLILNNRERTAKNEMYKDAFWFNK